MTKKSEEFFSKDKDRKKHDAALHDEILNDISRDAEARVRNIGTSKLAKLA
jgi:hypothetical protein